MHNRITQATQEQLPSHADVRTDCRARRHGKKERLLPRHQLPSLPTKSQRKRALLHMRGCLTNGEPSKPRRWLAKCWERPEPSQLQEPARNALSGATNVRQPRQGDQPNTSPCTRKFRVCLFLASVCGPDGKTITIGCGLPLQCRPDAKLKPEWCQWPTGLHQTVTTHLPRPPDDDHRGTRSWTRVHLPLGKSWWMAPQRTHAAPTPLQPRKLTGGGQGSRVAATPAVTGRQREGQMETTEEQHKERLGRELGESRSRATHERSGREVLPWDRTMARCGGGNASRK